MVKTMSYGDIWRIVDNLLEQGRSHHIRRYVDSRMNHCLLCAQRNCAVRHVVSKSRTGQAGFVDLSYPSNDTMMNGHVNSNEIVAAGKYRFPHVVGYYEVDTKKCFPKDIKKNNVSIDQLKSAVIRLANSSFHDLIPSSWLAFIRHVGTIKEQAPKLPCISFDEIVSMARSFEILPNHVQTMLQYFHTRGNLIFFGYDEVLSTLVVINPTWFTQVLSRTFESFDKSKYDVFRLFESLTDKELDRQLQKAGVSTITSAQWLLAAFQRLGLCLPLNDYSGEKYFVFPNLLEDGIPNQDVWPDIPEWDEKQVTCDIVIHTLKPGIFADLMIRITCEGRRRLEIVPDPAPVLLSHHIVFFTGIDGGGCDDCYDVRKKLADRSRNQGNDDEFDVSDDVLHKVHIMLHGNMDIIRVQVRGSSPCCTMKAVLSFIELYLDDLAEESSELSITDQCSTVTTNCNSDSKGSLTTFCEDIDDERKFFIICPKCVLLRQFKPERISSQCTATKRKAICSKWHNLGSWTRAVTGDYRFNNVDPHLSINLSTLPEYEHPRLVILLPPSLAVCYKEWYLCSRMKFLEGLEVHFLCENPTYWHMTEQSGYRLHRGSKLAKRSSSNQLPVILRLSLPFVQVIQGVHEHGQTGRLVSPVISDLLQMYDYLRNIDPHVHDSCAWLSKNKDRVVTMLTKVLANASDGLPDLYFKAGSSIEPEAVFQSPIRANRFELAKFLRIEASSGRFGSLRPLYVGKEVRWVCEMHYEELRTMPST